MLARATSLDRAHPQVDACEIVLGLQLDDGAGTFALGELQGIDVARKLRNGLHAHRFGGPEGTLECGVETAERGAVEAGHEHEECDRVAHSACTTYSFSSGQDMLRR